MKIPSTDLFDLVKSVSTKDIKEFKVYLNDAKQHIILLEYLVEQKEYDETKLLNHFSRPHYSTLKYELYNRLLDFLAFKNQYRNEQLKVYTKLEKASVLMNLGLHAQAKKELDKAGKICEKANLVGLELLVLEQKRELSLETTDHNFKSELVQLLTSKALNNINELDNSLKLQQYYDSMFLSGKSRLIDAGNTEVKDTLESLEKIDYSSFGLRTTILYLQTLAMGYFKTHQKDKTINHLTKASKIYEANPYLLKDGINDYLKVKLNIVSVDTRSKNIDHKKELIAIINLIKKTYKQQPSYNLKNKEIRAYVLLSEVFLMEENFEACIDATTKALNLSRKNKRPLLPLHEIVLDYMQFRAFFGLKNYKMSLKCINKILHEDYKGIRPDIKNFCRVAFLIVQYELGNFEELNHYLNSAKRYFSSQKHFPETEKLTIKLIRKLISEKANVVKEIDVFSNNIKALEANQEPILYLYFNFDAWISKIRITHQS